MGSLAESSRRELVFAKIRFQMHVVGAPAEKRPNHATFMSCKAQLMRINLPHHNATTVGEVGKWRKTDKRDHQTGRRVHAPRLEVLQEKAEDRQVEQREAVQGGDVEQQRQVHGLGGQRRSDHGSSGHKAAHLGQHVDDLLQLGVGEDGVPLVRQCGTDPV